MSTHYAPTDILARDATVNELLMPFLACVKRINGATDAFVNRPGEVFVEAGANTLRLNAPELTLDWALSLATAVATYSEQVIGSARPILSAMLPAGERLQVVLPPACELGTVSLSLRIPSTTIKPLQDFERDGAFSRYTWARPADCDKHKRKSPPLERHKSIPNSP